MLPWRLANLALLFCTYVSELTVPSAGELLSDLPGKPTLSNSAEDQLPKTPEKAAVFALEQTLAEVHLNEDGQSINICRLYEIESSEEENKVISSLKLPKVPLTLPEMLSVIEQCKVFSSNSSVEEPEEEETFSEEGKSAHNITTENPAPRRSWTIWTGILPGTMWCGMGDIANGYENLGTRKELDRCCRAHDHCPVKLKAFRTGWGLFNRSLYTKSHCDCDDNFYNCLKMAESQMSNILGNFYFNIMKVQCMKPQRTMVCSEKIVPLNGKSQCIRWKYASHTPKMSFINPEKRF